MAFEHTRLPVFGVQFHPESILTECGYDLLANFLRLAGLTAVDRVKDSGTKRACRADRPAHPHCRHSRSRFDSSSMAETDTPTAAHTSRRQIAGGNRDDA